jgi:misacylated tRNA(Ala) deacylase
MTKKLFLDDANLRGMRARVVAAMDDAVILDETVFYARSGGQPGDRGTLRWDTGEAVVIEAVKGEGDVILHRLAPGSALPPAGAEINGEIDWTLRHPLMRMHTALHLLCAALPGVSVTGGQIGAERSRLDFDIDEKPEATALEARLNALIAADHAVSQSWVDADILDTSPELVRTLSVKPPRGAGLVRLVRIGNDETAIDLQPCGGTHVTSTGQIGPVRIAKIENKGRQNRRITVEFAS